MTYIWRTSTRLNDCVNLGNKSGWNVPAHVSCASDGWTGAYEQRTRYTPAAQFSRNPPDRNIGKKVKAIARLIGPCSSFFELCVYFDPLTRLHLRLRGEIAAGGGVMNRSLVRFGIFVNYNRGFDPRRLIMSIFGNRPNSFPNLALIACEIGGTRGEVFNDILWDFEKLKKILIEHETPRIYWTNDLNDWHVAAADRRYWKSEDRKKRVVTHREQTYIMNK